MGLAAPGHRDHEADGKHPGDHPDRAADQEADRGLQPPVGVLVLLVGGGGEEPAEDQQHVDGADPGAQRPPRGRLLRQREVAHLEQRRAGRVDGRMHAAQHQHPRGGLELARVAAVERGGAQDHAPLLPEVCEIAGDERDQERRPGDRPVDPRDLRGLRAQFLGDHRARDVRARVAHAIRPLQRRLAEVLRAVQREPLSDVLRVAVGDPRQPPPSRQRAPESPGSPGGSTLSDQHLVAAVEVLVQPDRPGVRGARRSPVLGGSVQRQERRRRPERRGCRPASRAPRPAGRLRGRRQTRPTWPSGSATPMDWSWS